MNTSLSVLAKVLQVPCQQEASITGIAIDSRSIKAGELFIAIRGEFQNGHDFIPQAIQKGAAAIISDHPIDASIPVLVVKDTIQALGMIARFHRQSFSLTVLAVTGSCGKTSVKEMTRSILSCVGNVLASEGNLNNHLGVPLTLLKLNKTHQFAMIEMGANHVGEIAYLSSLAEPTISAVTLVAPAHVEGFGSIDKVAEAKSEIYSGLPEKGIAILNTDDVYAPFFESKIQSRLCYRFGKLANHADFFAKAIKLEQDSCQFILVTPHGETPISLAFGGEHQIHNALCASALAFAAGASLQAISEGLAKVSPVKGRLNVIRLNDDITVIDDTYNANVKSFIAAFDVLSRYPGEHMAIMGDMKELGDEAQHYHEAVGLAAKASGINRLITCGDFSRHAAKAFGQKAQHFETKQDLLGNLHQLIHPGMSILVKGSRGSAMEDVVKALIN